MRKNQAIQIFIAIIIAIMIVGFTIMIIFMGNHFGDASVTDSDTEAAFDVAEGATLDETEAEAEPIFMSDAIDLSIDDASEHAVEFEASYTNTLELLPSVNYAHAPVPKEDVDTTNFTRSFAGNISTELRISSAETGTTGVVTLPSEITLYNVSAELSCALEVQAEITGDDSLIQSIGWATDDSTKLSLSQTSGKKVTISRASDFTGDKNISVIVTYLSGKNATATETVDILVHVVDMADSDTYLCDNEGNDLYVDSSASRRATLSDYANQTTFYGPMRINGWQVISGETYYYDSNNQYVTGRQIIGGMPYEFDTDGVLLTKREMKGIDVSLYDLEIDWEKVKASGIDFAIIRAGFRGAVSGTLVQDSTFIRNIEGAKAAGLLVGVYFYTQAITEEEAAEEARMVLNLVKDYEIDLPIFTDSEAFHNGRADSLDKTLRTSILDSFCRTIEAAGYQAGIYASKYWFMENLNASDLEQYVIWVAQYNTEMNYTGKADYWQYTSTERIDGISTNVDVNVLLQ